MASPYPHLRQTPYASAMAIIGARRDNWGRFLFAPPELANPRTIFDPQPFREQPPPVNFGRRKARN